jgi:hypothetical protein
MDSISSLRNALLDSVAGTKSMNEYIRELECWGNL